MGDHVINRQTGFFVCCGGWRGIVLLLYNCRKLPARTFPHVIRGHNLMCTIWCVCVNNVSYFNLVFIFLEKEASLSSRFLLHV